MKNLTDEQLVIAYNNGDKNAFNEIYERYKTIVANFSRKFFLMGADSEDVIQEGMRGLFNAVVTYKDETSSFKNYAKICIKSSILTAVKKYSAGKMSILNKSLSIEVLDDSVDISFSPEDLIISKESQSEIFKKIEKVLSKTELSVLKCYLEGLNYAEISDKLNITTKAVDNALSRAKKKIIKLIEV